MKIKLLITLATTFLLSIAVFTTYAASNIDLWQIGTPDGDVDPITGSLEYPATESWVATYDYYIGSDGDPISAPSMPGYLDKSNPCAYSGGKPCTDATADLYIHFNLACSYQAGELSLEYNRYGSEIDNLYLDGNRFASVSGTEGGFRQFNFDLGAVAVGSHTLRIEYAGGGSGNGHYIDYLKIDPIKDCPIPIDIDIKPGSYSNSMNINSKGVIPVAILGTADFDVSSVDLATLSFAGLAVRMKGNDRPQCSVHDVSGDFTTPEGAPDGYIDLVCQFVNDPGLWTNCNGTAELTGNLNDGSPFIGSDTISIVKK